MESTFLQAIEGKLNVKIGKAIPVSGGSINAAYCIITDKGKFFVKCNSASRYPGMFEKEAGGLRLLASSAAIALPEIVLEDESFLVLKWVEVGRRKSNFYEIFGRQLAEMHRFSSANFGLDHDNYIGSLQQKNDWKKSWTEFFITCRIEPLLESAKQHPSGIQKNLASLYKQLDNIFPVEKPALLHGDLWSGNYMVNETGNPLLIDPAVYFGHREMDIAMTTLFGRCDDAFYQSYHNAYPLHPGWEERIDICNLYPLLVHVNLFGRSYWSGVENILNRF
ncbi:MAG: fructosamine kinase family protein [Flavobacteriales bacterium]